MFAFATETDASGGIFVIAVTLLVIALTVAYLVWYIWLLLDMNKQPDGAWAASNQNKSLWQILWVVGLCVGGGLIIGLIYQFAIRPKVQAAAGAV
jgi:heme/copper-type cytochrome/quinol oxidase subunit 2